MTWGRLQFLLLLLLVGATAMADEFNWSEFLQSKAPLQASAPVEEIARAGIGWVPWKRLVGPG